MIPVFDYRNLTVEHKEAAEEIANVLLNLGQPMLAEMIKQKFEVVERPRYDLNQSEFINLCKQANIYCSIQGYTLDNGIEYPLVTICEDIRKLNQFCKLMNDNSSRN